MSKTKISKTQALGFAIFALNTLEHPDASSDKDLADLEVASKQVIKRLCKMRDKASQPAPDTLGPIQADVDAATYALHFGIMGDLGSFDVPVFHIGVPGLFSEREAINANEPHPEELFRVGANAAILDSGSWRVWGEDDEDDTFHVVVYFAARPDWQEAHDTYWLLASRVAQGRVLDYACLTTMEDWSDDQGTYMFHVNNDQVSITGPLNPAA